MSIILTLYDNQIRRNCKYRKYKKSSFYRKNVIFLILQLENHLYGLIWVKNDFPVFENFDGLKALKNMFNTKKSRKSNNNLVLGGIKNIYFEIFYNIGGVQVFGPLPNKFSTDFYEIWLILKQKWMTRRYLDYIFKFELKLGVKRA